MNPPADGLQQSPAAAEASAASPSPPETGGATSVNQFFVQKSRTRTAPVTICDAPVGKKNKTSWVWQVMQEFAPPINNKNVRCIVMVLKNAVYRAICLPQCWDTVTKYHLKNRGVGNRTIRYRRLRYRIPHRLRHCLFRQPHEPVIRTNGSSGTELDYCRGIVSSAGSHDDLSPAHVPRYSG